MSYKIHCGVRIKIHLLSVDYDNVIVYLKSFTHYILHKFIHRSSFARTFLLGVIFRQHFIINSSFTSFSSSVGFLDLEMN